MNAIKTIAATLFLLLTMQIKAQEFFIHTDFEPDSCYHIYSCGGDSLTVDVNKDGNPDVGFYGYMTFGSGICLKVCSFGNCELIGYSASSINNPEEIQINLLDNWSKTANFYPAYPNTNDVLEYICLRFLDENEYYYGWMKVDLSDDNYPTVCIDEMTYCAIPDFPLKWGEKDLKAENPVEWYYEILNVDGSITYQHLQYSNDTVIENKRPKIIIRSNTLYDEKIGAVVTHEYVYEENGIVYWWNKTLNEFTVLYNLSAEAGDEWQIKVGTETITVHVDAVDDYDYEGRTYKMLQVSDENDVFSGTIVCGIGHLTSFFPERLMSKSGDYRVEGIRCYWENGELVFKYGDKDCDEVYIELHYGIEESDNQAFSVFPNPAKGFMTIETEEENASYEIMNVMGQTVLSGSLNGTKQINVSDLSDGMYFIKAGQKTVKFVIRN